MTRVVVEDQTAFVSVVAQQMINDVAALQGLITTARRLIEPDLADLSGAAHLMRLAEDRTFTALETLQRYMRAADTGRRATEHS